MAARRKLTKARTYPGTSTQRIRSRIRGSSHRYRRWSAPPGPPKSKGSHPKMRPLEPTARCRRVCWSYNTHRSVKVNRNVCHNMIRTTGTISATGHRLFGAYLALDMTSETTRRAEELRLFEALLRLPAARRDDEQARRQDTYLLNGVPLCAVAPAAQ